jgi:hypothetical protein
MKRQNLAIAVLSLTAAILAAAHVFAPSAATGQVVVKERDYQVVTARIQTGGDGLYILENGTGNIAVFTYDPSARALRARSVGNVADAFGPPR